MRTARGFTLALVTTAALAGAAAPAGASTTFHAGPIAYACQFPDGSPQTVTLTDAFTGPDTVAPDVNFRTTNVSGSVTLSPAALTWFTSRGSDGLLGGRVAAFAEAANAPRSSTAAATITPDTWGAGPVAAGFTGGQQTHHSGTSGSITFTAGQLVLMLSLHRPDGTPAFVTSVCHPEDGQDTAFTPALPIGPA
ncbi:DUF6801 domain-containing protein [Amycolatopsis sp. cmx-4-61]|uniref:DUF6801 domain-containing protein n=1 Tax=Amycolatopsis sp. cmx-4-61 TaxID=2790937 RepID=UPI00397BD36A